MGGGSEPCEKMAIYSMRPLKMSEAAHGCMPSVYRKKVQILTQFRQCFTHFLQTYFNK